MCDGRVSPMAGHLTDSGFQRDDAPFPQSHLAMCYRVQGNTCTLADPSVNRGEIYGSSS
jgi:hypothetical protein